MRKGTGAASMLNASQVDLLWQQMHAVEGGSVEMCVVISVDDEPTLGFQFAIPKA